MHSAFAHIRIGLSLYYDVLSWLSGMQDSISALLDIVGSSQMPEVWSALSPHVKAEIAALMNEDSETCVQFLIQALQENVLNVVDLRGMVGRIVEQDLRILCNMFLSVGGNEFNFIRRSGLYFGFLFGIFQVRPMLRLAAFSRWPSRECQLVYVIPDASLTMPLTVTRSIGFFCSTGRREQLVIFCSNANGCTRLIASFFRVERCVRLFLPK
jgi:hypothetical protein